MFQSIPSAKCKIWTKGKPIPTPGSITVDQMPEEEIVMIQVYDQSRGRITLSVSISDWFQIVKEVSEQ